MNGHTPEVSIEQRVRNLVDEIVNLTGSREAAADSVIRACCKAASDDGNLFELARNLGDELQDLRAQTGMAAIAIEKAPVRTSPPINGIDIDVMANANQGNYYSPNVLVRRGLILTSDGWDWTSKTYYNVTRSSLSRLHRAQLRLFDIDRQAQQ